MARRPRPGNPLLAVATIRVSTDRQDLGPAAQRSAIEAWAVRSGVTVVAWFEDTGISGAAPVAERPGLVAALAALREHGAGVLVAGKRDRIARDPVIAAMVERMAVAAGALVRTADGASDALGAEGVMMKGIVDVFAAYEREVIRVRTRSALAVKKARGERVGGVPYGFSATVDGHLVKNGHEQAMIADVRALRADGNTIRQIVAALAATGRRSRKGTPFGIAQVHGMMRAA
jgi:DNA invertase Pin-like site-specific DNA recombinase